MNNILLTGSNRGIGLGLVKAILKNEKSKAKQIIATCRKPEEAKELQDIAKNNGNLHILKLDIGDLSSFKDFSEKVKNIVQDDGLNMLINNAGIAGKFLRINFVTADTLKEQFLVNTVAPIMLAKEMVPLLCLGAQKSEEPVKAAIVNISSILGSISANDVGGYYPYRCSKSALNAATRSLSVDLKSKNVAAISIHPGWVKTDMGGPKAPLGVEEATSKIVETLSSLKPEQNGTFLNYDGKPLNW